MTEAKNRNNYVLPVLYLFNSTNEQSRFPNKAFPLLRALLLATAT